MDQNRKTINLDKQEYICLSCMQGTNPKDSALKCYDFLFGQLTCPDGGVGAQDDDETPSYSMTSPDRSVVLVEVHHKSLFPGAVPSPKVTFSFDGRWKGDRICLIGPHVESSARDLLPNLRNISQELMNEWNQSQPDDLTRLAFNEDCICKDR